MAVLLCSSCSHVYSSDQVIWRCECGGVLNLHDLPTLKKDQLDTSAYGLWRYRCTFPLKNNSEAITLGEMRTPLIPFSIEKRTILLKLDYLFPSGSFKDRGSSIMISKVKELGIEHVIEDSSGNAGASISAYCARAGISCDIYIPSTTSPAKIKQIEATGAQLIQVPSSREETAKAALKAASTAYYASHVWNPYFFQGTKTCAFEIVETLNWSSPKRIVVPVGNGTLLLGLFLGFSELVSAGIIPHLPRLVAVQSAHCSPLVDAYVQHSRSPMMIQKQPTLAEGIAVAEPLRGSQILAAIHRCRGEMIQVSELEIKEAFEELAAEGIYVEPTAAVAVAGYRKLCLKEQSNESTVIILTGHGLKSVTM
ncbi:MAG: pyridoxal-phosphate dependent enzyme [Calditrichaeota bacterium]|nr:MAG: pyridoxal-phosphate dependent enzyme [Calditrichota bacterium]